jgi:VanZ family protein
MLYVRFWRILAIVVAAGIAVLSLIPKPPEIPIGFHFADKIAHYIAYVVLSFLVFASVSEGKRIGASLTTVLVVAASCVIFGGLIEILQMFTGRRPELWDLVADLIGAVSGALLGVGLRGRLRGKQT